MCAPTGQRIPFGSPEPSAFTYSKSFNCSGEIPPAGLSVSGDKARGTPLRHRPHIFAASSSGSILSLFDCRKSSKPTTSVSTFLKTAKLPFRPSSSRLGNHRSSRRPPARRRATARRAAGDRADRVPDRREWWASDAVGVSEVNLGGRHGLAVLHLHQRHPVLAPDLSKGISLGEPGTQPVAVARHRLRADGVQRHQDVIVPASETADPVLGRARSGIADRLRTLRGSFDERPKGPERQRRDAFLDLQRNQSGPRDADVEAVVGLAARGIGGIVSRSGREPHMPVLGSRDLGSVDSSPLTSRPSCRRACAGAPTVNKKCRTIGIMYPRRTKPWMSARSSADAAPESPGLEAIRSAEQSAKQPPSDVSRQSKPGIASSPVTPVLSSGGRL